MEYFTPHTTKNDYPGRVLVLQKLLNVLVTLYFFLDRVISSIKDMDMRFLT